MATVQWCHPGLVSIEGGPAESSDRPDFRSAVDVMVTLPFLCAKEWEADDAERLAGTFAAWLAPLADGSAWPPEAARSVAAMAATAMAPALIAMAQVSEIRRAVAGRMLSGG
ncbi:hypothetical protein [Streptomyces tubercidicus]|uniref:hypothetical protein n=1 Tax=Streptomyces tubercidicus TaxID=47759 RepID=UPI003689B2A9